jgi:Ca2+-binding EF-hand superfamily protein
MSAGMGMGGLADGQPLMLQYFDQIDADRNGQLSRAEITAFAEKVRQQVWERVVGRFNAADVNADGSLTPEEAAANMPMLSRHLDFVDANDDSLVTLDEVRRALDPATMRARVLERLRAADADHDGRISPAEAQQSLPRVYAQFEQLDANHDGFLTVEDFQQMTLFPG